MLLLADGVDLYLGSVVLVRMSEPGDQREDRHGHRHTEIGRHLAVVRKTVGDRAVDKAENYYKHLTDRIALGAENKRGYSYKRGKKSGVAATVKYQKGQYY